MGPDSAKTVTQLLVHWSNGDQKALDALMPLVYDELRRLAASYLRHERRDHTLQPTALVNEAYLRLAADEDVHWQNRNHFFGVAAQVMRRVLVDHARKHHAEKRGGELNRIPLTEALAMSQQQPEQLLALDESLARLTALDPQQGRIVELRVFGGLSVEEVSSLLGISPATVKRDWSVAKAWLMREIERTE